MDRQEAFALLQPASVRLAKEGSVESVRALRQEVERVIAKEDSSGGDCCTSSINDLKEYLLFPVTLLLKSGKASSWTLQEELVGVLHVVLRCSIIEDFTLFQELFLRLFLILTDKTNPQKVGDSSEECKQTALEAVSLLAKNSANSVKEKMCGDAFRPQLGHAVFLCLKLSQEEKNRSLKLQALETLSALGLQKSFSTLTAEQQNILSCTFANFLPGIVIGLTKVATADEKQGHKITAAAIDTWSYFVMLVMRDNFLEEHTFGLGESKTEIQLQKQLFGEEALEGSKKRKQSSQQNELEQEAIPPKMPNIQITEEWAQKTGDNLLLLVQSITKLVTHSHWRVRLSLVQWAQQLISSCCRSLSGAVVMAVEVIVTLRSDDVADVGSSAQYALLAVTQILERNGQHTQSKQSLLEMLEERVFALSTKLPTLCRQQDDAKTLASVRQLLGCLEVLGERIAQLVTWPSHSHRLLQALSFALTQDTTDPDLLLERTNSEDPFEVLTVKPSLGRCFRYFQDVRILEALGSVCQLIGYHGSIMVLTDLCIDLLQQTTHHQKEMLIMLTFIIQGRDQRKLKEKDRSNIPPEENEQVVQNVLDIIICQEVFNAQVCIVTQDSTSNTEDLFMSVVPVKKQENISVDLVKSNVVLVANTLRLISACARMMATDFKMFLSKVLCSVMEKAGESNVLVGHTAKNTLIEIAESCEYKNVSELIEKSVPQFWYPLSMRLKRLPQYPTAPLVLQVSLEYTNIDVLAFTEELVEDVLACLDTYHSDQALPLLRVLLVYVTAVIRYESETKVSKEVTNAGNDNDECLDDKNDGGKSEIRQEGEFDYDALYNDHGQIARFLENYHKNITSVKLGLEGGDLIEPEEASGKENSQTPVNQQDTDSAVDDITEKSEEKKEIPKYIELVVDILERCSHLLYSHDRKIKLLIMEIVKAGCEALTHWEDQRLPVLHKLWKPLTLRLKDSDFVVMIRSLEVLSTMLVTSGEFLRHRTLSQVFPPLLSFLKNQSHTSLGKTKRSGYYMTAAYRAQNVILRKFTSLVPSLVLGVVEMAELVNVLMLYLDTRQPVELCSEGITLVKQIAKSHPHHIWLALAHQQSSVRIIAPTPDLASIKITGADRSELPPEVVDLYRQLS